ncbi:hypothetical protein RJ641_024730 [Dillenia turbinata]|uniref:C2H2-type domain-containing protein n=1 Tax=Dillenia turbinata TaxID=194707 RepID=A0AAN8VZE7_9MAGN
MEKTEHHRIWNTEDQSSGSVRTYECNFCRRGFSNAQALGGHMNIHRKDRARLKEPLDETLLYLDMSPEKASSPSTNLQSPPLGYFVGQVGSSYLGKSCIPKRPWEEDDKAVPPDHKKEITVIEKLPLFLESPSSTKVIDLEASSDGLEREEEEKMGSHASSKRADLDLELRLVNNILAQGKELIFE